MPSKLEEKAWIARCKLFGDQKAFGYLVDAYKGPVIRFFLMQTGGDQLLSDDLAQETFIRAWQRIKSLTQDKYFSSWLYRIGYNIWIDYVRVKKQTVSLEQSREVLSKEDEVLTNRKVEDKDRHNVLIEALSHLNEQERTSLTLFYLNEFSIKEISQITGYTEGSVRCYLSRGRDKLRQEPELMQLRK